MPDTSSDQHAESVATGMTTPARKDNDHSPVRSADYAPNPEMLRRAAEACRNIQKQATGRVDWFDWVSTYLDYWATQIDGSPDGC